MNNPIDHPVVLNPEAVGDPNQTPVVRMPENFVELLGIRSCDECGYLNQGHAYDCSKRVQQ